VIAWVDIETTAIDPAEGEIIEVAIVLTDDELNSVGQIDLLVRPLSPDLGSEWALKTHKESGLLREAEAGWFPLVAQEHLCHFLSAHGGQGAPMASNSIHFDRRWLQVYMPKLEAMFDYHNVDISSLRFLSMTWGWTASFAPDEEKPHRAMADIHRSIAELKFYREIIEGRMGVAA
jgi:oligoribonuclease